MIPLSTRNALPVGLAMLLLAIPVAYHGLAKPTASTCANSEATLADDFLPDVVKRQDATSEDPGFIDGSSGELSLPGNWIETPHFRVTRTYELGRYYFVPIGNFTSILPSDTIETIPVVVDGTEIMLHLRLDETERVSVTTAHFYLVGGRPVDNPFFGSFAQAIRQLRVGKLPLTMILANGISKLEDSPEARENLIDWARRAWIAYDKTCNAFAGLPSALQP